MVFFAELKGGGTRDVLQSASERAVGLLALYRRFFGFGVSRLPSWYGYIGKKPCILRCFSKTGRNGKYTKQCDSTAKESVKHPCSVHLCGLPAAPGIFHFFILICEKPGRRTPGEANGAGRAGLSGGRCCNRLGRGSDLSAFAVFPGKSNRMRQAAHTKRKRLHAGFEKWRIVWKMVFSCGAYPVRQEKPDRGRPP